VEERTFRAAKRSFKMMRFSASGNERRSAGNSHVLCDVCSEQTQSTSLGKRRWHDYFSMFFRTIVAKAATFCMSLWLCRTISIFPGMELDPAPPWIELSHWAGF
jgi:hypothetical protein